MTYEVPKLLAKVTSLRIKYPGKRTLMSNADVSDASRNFRRAPDPALNFCCVSGGVLEANLPLTFGWAGSSGFWGFMSSTAEHAHCDNSLTDAVVLPQRTAMMSPVRITNPGKWARPLKFPARPGFDRQWDETSGPVLFHGRRGRLPACTSGRGLECSFRADSVSVVNLGPC